MNALPEAQPISPPTHLPAPLRRYLLAWTVMIGGLVGFWCCRPWMGKYSFAVAQIAVLLGTCKIASLLCLPLEAWARFTPLRILAYCVYYGMQPRQFLVGQRSPVGAPIPTFTGILLNAAAGAVLLWFVPRLLPREVPWAIRLWIALVGITFLELFARLDFLALVFRWMGFAVEKNWDCPIAATSLGDFWGRRWNRIVPGFLREVIFVPVSRLGGAKVGLLAVFLYSGLYHECLSVMAKSGYGRPALYFLLQYFGVAIENTHRARRLLRGRRWLARVWTLAFVVGPVELFLHPGFVNAFLVPSLIAIGVPGLQR